MTTEEEATAALKRAAKRYEAAQAKREAAMNELAEAMREADVAGVPRNEIQRVSGVARQTMYRVVDGAKAARK
jgi:predicted DNA-binding protein (UPF0251 family)